MMNIVLLDALTLGPLEEIGHLNKFGNFLSYETTRPEEVVSRIHDADIVITNKVVIGAREIDAAGRLKLICVAATGMNNIDLAHASDKNISVRNVKGYSTESVAQQVFAMLLARRNHVSHYDNFVKSVDGYCQSPIFCDISRPIFELAGKTMGIIGLGAIGKKVAGIAQAFGMKVIYYSTSGANQNASYEQVGLEHLLKHSDVVSIHAPLNERTQDLISYKQIRLMKHDAILMNSGRGGIINELDLARALNEDRIGVAILDVYAQEPIDKHHPLLDLKDPEKAVLSPHIAWASVEARKRLVSGVVANIEDFIKQN